MGAADSVAETDRASIGLIRHSMDGHGSLTTAGAVLDPQAPALAQLPEPARQLAVQPGAGRAGLNSITNLLAISIRT